MTTETAVIPPDAMTVLDAWGEALRNKDLDALAKCYADDVRVFDIVRRRLATISFADCGNRVSRTSQIRSTPNERTSRRQSGLMLQS